MKPNPDEQKRGKDPDVIKKKTQELFDKNYATRPGVAVSMDKDKYDRIFSNVEIVREN